MDFEISPRTGPGTGAPRLAISVPTFARLETEVRARLRARAGFALATLNLDHLVKLRENPAFRAAYLAQDLVVADGNPVVWLSRLAKRPVELMPGSELVIPLARLAAQEGRSLALVGASDPALRDAARVLQAEAPGLEIAYLHAPPMGFDPQSPGAAEILREIAASGAGLCFLALGAPKQEIFAALGRELAPQTGFASIGAGLDFLGGHQQRAPVLVRRLALEWLWRMLSSPRRLGMRYLRCALLLPALVRDAWGLRGRA